MDWEALWNWLSNSANQDTLAWLGGGFVVLATGVWAVFKFRLQPKKQQSPSVQVKADRGSVAAGRDAHVTHHNSEK